MKNVFMGLVIASALVPMMSHAADGRIDFTGEITGQTCKINDGNPNMTVTLPKVSTTALKDDGATAGNTVFSVKLTECQPNSGGARVFFEAGPTVDLATGRLNLVGSTATKVQVGIANAEGTDIKIGQPNGSANAFTTINNGSAELTYLARYVSNGGGTTAGTVKTNVMYTIEYQ